MGEGFVIGSTTGRGGGEMELAVVSEAGVDQILAVLAMPGGAFARKLTSG